MSNHTGYKPFPPVSLPDRTWPDKVIGTAPIWCSVDLRDGNQALINPMGEARKLEMWKALVAIGFKEIEVGFPSASDTDFSFVRKLIEEDLIPDGVTIQVLTQAREHLIRRTFEAIRGAKSVIVHLYNSTSTLQREVVFKAGKEEIKQIAVNGARLIMDLVPTVPETKITHQYSPESFTGTEIDYAAEVCDAVAEVYQPTPDNKLIINLPATVELATPNVHADQIELFCRIYKQRANSIISLHTHNDRGTGIAATELGLMAGADRVEGTLFGNGERTGNLDLVTTALNMFTQGIDTGLDFSDIKRIRAMAEHCTELPVHERHPYAGDLAFVAFSGSHQDAIKKGFDALAAKRETNPDHGFEVPYLTIDPKDIGRQYEPIIRVNSQSGKGGVAFLVKEHLGYDLPRPLQVEFSGLIQQQTDASGVEMSGEEIGAALIEEYVSPPAALTYQSQERTDKSGDMETRRFNVSYKGEAASISGTGNGPISALLDALRTAYGLDFAVLDYTQHTLAKSSDAQAVAYVRIGGTDGGTHFGIGIDSSITRAPLHAIVAAVNRAVKG